MRNAAATAAATSVAKYTVCWKSVTWLKRCWNGTVSRKPKRICTPGIATRSSLRSSIICRLRRSCSSSLRSSRRSCSPAGVMPRGYARAPRDSSRACDRLDRVAHRVDRAADEPRDVHLRDADGTGDLALGEALVVAQADDLALALAEAVEAATEQDPLLGELVALVVAADGLERSRALGQRLVERHHPGGVGGAQRVEDLLDADAERVRDLGHGRRAAELARERLAGAHDARAELLDVARDAQHPTAVAEVALQLAGDRRHGERREPHVARDVEAVDGLQQAERRDLLEVVQRLALAGVATGEAPRERQHPLGELRTRGTVSVLVPPAQQPADLIRPTHWTSPPVEQCCLSILALLNAGAKVGRHGRRR